MISTAPARDRLRELKAALPDGCDSDFIWQMLQENASVEYAISFFPSWSASRKAKGSFPRIKGQTPLSEFGSDDYSGESFETLVAELMKAKNLDRRTASRLVAKSHPEAHEAFLDTCPKGRDS